MPTTSFSEVSSYVLCKRRHFYGYSRQLERIETSDSLTEGKMIHSILETFYRAVLEGVDFEDAVELAYSAFILSGYQWDKDKKRADVGRMLFDFYFPNEPFVRQGYRVLAVEKEFLLEWDSETEDRLPFVIDLILRDPQGRIAIVDHKSAYDFIDDDATALQPQVPLYMAALRALGYPADYGLYNQIRTRPIVGKKTAENPDGEGPTLEQAMKVTHIRPTTDRLVQTFQEQVGMAREINERKRHTLSDQSETAWRVANKMVCNTCAFKELCIGELNGSNTDLIERTYYKARERRSFTLITEEVA